MKKQDVEIINAEIETLNESITWWSNRFNAVERDNRELRKEIERLNKKLEDLEKLNNANYQSFIETNKIIIELEKWLNEEYDATIFDYHNAIEDVLNKLQELKGSD